jgi:hypothetical protein
MKRLATALLLLLAFGAETGFAQGKISGLMFGDYFYNVARDSVNNRTSLPNQAVGGQKDLQAFQFRRIYFTYDNDISDKFTTRFRLEADQALASGTGDVLSSGKISVFVKDAYLRWKNIFAGSDFYFGIQPTGAYEISEAAWGYRSLEKTIMDLRGISPSRELGVSLHGKFDDPGVFNYWVMVSNNGSGNVPNGTDASVDKYKRYSLLFHVKPTANLQVTLYGQFKGAPNVNDPTSGAVPKATVGHNTMLGAAFVGYKMDTTFSVGVEGFMQSVANAFVPTGSTTLKSASTLGFSVFGYYNFTPQWSAVARYDYFDPNTDGTVTGDARSYIIAGMAYKPVKNVQIIPNIQYETYQAPPAPARSLDASLTARVTFYFVFL